MITTIPIHERLWKVTLDNEVAGYVDMIDARDGIRFRARRLNVRYRRWVALGEYWELQAAIDALAS